MDCTNTYLIKETSGGSEDQESGNSLNRFLELPEDVIANILHRLGAYEILKNAQRVCSLWRKICKDPSMWRFIDMKHLGRYGYFGDVRNKYLETMCRQAVDMSQGQLTELHIDHFATDQLLHYISERSSMLKSLQLRGCDEVGIGFIEAAKTFPLLEELHFVYVLGVRNYIEAIGQSCPKLKSFTLSSSDYIGGPLYGYGECNDNLEALAIAKTMPGLHHLEII
ncbi:unnamed protein product [Cuscuta campestris]|uniref:F-box domain-containing protein n=1 Tax=Cuscuta campestris TaxID=132261 RepID=A0A484LQ45_9ASTE|nr:unnamed protein product [Cuscuta campestris]